MPCTSTPNYTLPQCLVFFVLFIMACGFENVCEIISELEQVKASKKV